MLHAIKRLFGGARPPNALWKVMEEMDPWLSYDRFLALRLPKRQRPLVQGLTEGAVKPGDVDGVRRWAARHEEDYNGIAALVYALQQAMESSYVHYLFEHGSVVPTARFPRYVDDQSMSMLFNDRENHLQIASVQEFVRFNNLSDYVLEPLTFAKYETTIERRAQEYLGTKLSHAEKGQYLYKGRRISVTVHRKQNADQQIEVAVSADDIANALCGDGIDVVAEDITLERPICELGCFDVTVRVEHGVSKIASLWVVPAVE